MVWIKSQGFIIVSNQFMGVNKTLKMALKSIFSISTLILLLIFCIIVNEKIQQPEFKNLQTKGIVFLGVVVLILLYLNLKYVFTFFKNKKK